jgi:hypothetical protein
VEGVPSSRGALALADLGNGLPLRRSSLDGAVRRQPPSAARRSIAAQPLRPLRVFARHTKNAQPRAGADSLRTPAQVSVSALQWLAATGDSTRSDSLQTAGAEADADEDASTDAAAAAAAARCAAFFRALSSALAPGAPAALQVYPACDAEAVSLTAAAEKFFPRPLLLVDFPHASPAKKLFLCVRKPSSAAPREVRRAEEARGACACALAWPRRAACAAEWWRASAEAREAAAAAAHSGDGGAGDAARARLEEEHTRCAAAPRVRRAPLQNADASDCPGRVCCRAHARVLCSRSYARRLLRLLRRGVAVADGGGGAAATAAAAERALAATAPHAAARWCDLGRLAVVAAPPAHAAAADAAADALRAAGWRVERRTLAAEEEGAAAAAAGAQRSAASKRPAAEPVDEDARVTATGSDDTPQEPPQQQQRAQQQQGRRGRNAAALARRAQLRANAGATPDAAFASLLHGDTAAVGGVRAGVLLSPDAAPHGAAALPLAAAPHDGGAAAAAALRAVAALTRPAAARGTRGGGVTGGAAGSGAGAAVVPLCAAAGASAAASAVGDGECAPPLDVCALELALRPGANGGVALVWGCWLLMAGPWGRADAAAGAARLGAVQCSGPRGSGAPRGGGCPPTRGSDAP